MVPIHDDDADDAGDSHSVGLHLGRADEFINGRKYRRQIHVDFTAAGCAAFET